ncbi:bifunctional DNA primase/polymerase [Mycolicibacterium holsaticum]|uniref:bifunctional DNA primase/polymerase n=1 Tax=Mycolicibacterium holsaticum TaxID=152142 RepID=UPI001C7CAB6C|nr:bifunctional DNA primase/polymerase [Mycolicibacterium holsaticum]MDA4105704.1 hypothetical protein [Mycolicibacterium holsaticum DSM 44478 = JCM 12374]QZA13925.1 bifunctional DNA primase/polymerase [Mycolicibacterium holsaticum DSM 44478 = JCM 12374]UNC08615.1 bifunctional DNA primase/polymerase [Mycolicibacterium holsaticum DSM 44478 = JCM 12374]
MTQTLPDKPAQGHCVSATGCPVAEPPSIPDLSGIRIRPGYAGSQYRGALAWAEAGWYELPTDPYGFTNRSGEYVQTIKRPGSLVGRQWYKFSTRDPEDILEWWGWWWPWAGIALDCGASGAVVFDLDVPDLAVLDLDGRTDLADALRGAEGRMRTRRAGQRGHYPFALRRNADGTLAELYGDTAGAFGRYGEVRCHHAVVIAAPTPHPDPDSGGHYSAIPGHLAPLPDVLRACLGPNLLLLDSGIMPTAPMSDAELDEFLKTNSRYGNTMKLRWVVGRFHRRVEDGESRHRVLTGCLSWAFEEARCGYYPASMALRELAEAFVGRFGKGEQGKRITPDSDEVLNAAKWAAASANQIDVADRIARRNAAR